LIVDQFHGLPFFTPIYIRKPKLAVVQEVARDVWLKNHLPRPVNFIVGVTGYLLEPLFFIFYKGVKFMTGSESAKKDLISVGISDKNISIVPHGVKLTLPKVLKKKEKVETVLFLGALAKDKGIEDALQAFSILQKKGKYQFWVIGRAGDTYKKTLEQLVEKLSLTGKVRFWGFASERQKFDLLSRAHLLINPSMREGWGLVNIEANAVGTPVVAYSSQGLVDSVKNNYSGILCRSNKPTTLANEVYKLLKNKTKYHSLKRKAVLWSNQFTWDKSKKLSLDLINNLTEHKKKASFKWKKILAYAAVFVIFTILLGNIVQNWGIIRESQNKFSLPSVGLLILVVSSLHLLNSCSWHLLTKAMGFKISFVDNLRIWMFPSLGKYVPGKIWQYVGRVYLLSEQGLNKGQGSLVVLLDALFTLSIGAFVSLLTIFTFKLPIMHGLEWVLFAVILLPVGVTLLFANKRFMDLAMSFLGKITKKKYDLATYRFSTIWLTVLAFVTFTQFIIAGLSLYFIAASLFDVSFSLMPVFVCAYAASWILGYVSLFAPGGLGVQEISMAGILAIVIPFPVASLTAILFRFALTLAEVIVLGIVFMLSKNKGITSVKKL
jgi:glycosyltransferase involved in cell wall biosynthesis/uncharacterized membrane protein YbhN (UPF0104 family)